MRAPALINTEREREKSEIGREKVKTNRQQGLVSGEALWRMPIANNKVRGPIKKKPQIILCCMHCFSAVLYPECVVYLIWLICYLLWPYVCAFNQTLLIPSHQVSPLFLQLSIHFGAWWFKDRLLVSRKVSSHPDKNHSVKWYECIYMYKYHPWKA